MWVANSWFPILSAILVLKHLMSHYSTVWIFMISTSQRHAKHSFAGQNTQHSHTPHTSQQRTPPTIMPTPTQLEDRQYQEKRKFLNYPVKLTILWDSFRKNHSGGMVWLPLQKLCDDHNNRTKLDFRLTKLLKATKYSRKSNTLRRTKKWQDYLETRL